MLLAERYNEERRNRRKGKGGKRNITGDRRDSGKEEGEWTQGGE